MISFSWWEFNGKKKKLPKNLIHGKHVFLDRRYKVNRDFINDKRWVYKNPIRDFFAKKMGEYIFLDTPITRKPKKGEVIKFRRYGDIDASSSD